MGILRSQNKITNFFIILAWSCRFKGTIFYRISPDNYTCKSVTPIRRSHDISWQESFRYLNMLNLCRIWLIRRLQHTRPTGYCLAAEVNRQHSEDTHSDQTGEVVADRVPSSRSNPGADRRSYSDKFSKPLSEYARKNIAAALAVVKLSRRRGNRIGSFDSARGYFQQFCKEWEGEDEGGLLDFFYSGPTFSFFR